MMGMPYGQPVAGQMPAPMMPMQGGYVMGAGPMAGPPGGAVMPPPRGMMMPPPGGMMPMGQQPVMMNNQQVTPMQANPSSENGLQQTQEP